MKTAVSLTLKQRLQLNKQHIENKNQRDHMRQKLSHPKHFREKLYVQQIQSDNPKDNKKAKSKTRNKQSRVATKKSSNFFFPKTSTSQQINKKFSKKRQKN